ncbi:uncharacterized protein [Littorina saxatilis]|uniref:uncharacterized protein n=1 Tax=Littorina saxatilis TaxID=31220 RepID=UPI0038B51766
MVVIKIKGTIVFQATRRESWTGDIGLDDIKVYLNCSEMTVGTTPRADDITTASSVTTMQPPPGSTGVTTPPPPPPTTTTTATMQRTTTPGHSQDFSTRQSTASSILPSSSTTDVSGSGSSEGDYIKDYTEGEAGGEGEGSETDTRSASSSQGAGPTVSDYLPLIIGVTLGVLVGVAVVGVLAWLWTRNKRKQKALRVEEDQLNIIGTSSPAIQDIVTGNTGHRHRQYRTSVLSRVPAPTLPPVSNFGSNAMKGTTDPSPCSTPAI